MLRPSNRLNKTPTGMLPPCGLTLIELLIAMSIMAMVVGTLGGLAHGVRTAFEYTEGYGVATQHARVVLDRIARRVEGAKANAHFPGFLVVPEIEGTWEFPETLVIWRPNGAPANPNGLPRYNELVIYTPNLNSPGQLMEMTVPLDDRTVPPTDELSRWRSELKTIREGSGFESTVLTHLLRVCLAPEGNRNAPWRGAVRFQSRLLPSEQDWSLYTTGDVAWQELPWAQGIHGSQTGLRQASLQIELQLTPGDLAFATSAGSQAPAVFFGAATLYYQLER